MNIKDPATASTPKLIQLCDQIIAGYAAGLSGLDDGMVDHLLELGNRAEEIKQLVAGELAARQALRDLVVHRDRRWYTGAIGGNDVTGDVSAILADPSPFQRLRQE